MTHPITPPPELVQQWYNASPHANEDSLQDVANAAAQWGANQELEACCEWLKLEGHEHEHEALLAARRPKPPSLKEQALEAARIELDPTGKNGSLIIRALEQLDD
jgi:hypothetical protein